MTLTCRSPGETNPSAPDKQLSLCTISDEHFGASADDLYRLEAPSIIKFTSRCEMVSPSCAASLIKRNPSALHPGSLQKQYTVLFGV